MLSKLCRLPSALGAVTDAIRAILGCRADIPTRIETFNRMSNTWKGRSRQNQEATLEVTKDNLREKVCYYGGNGYSILNTYLNRYEKRRV
jgi:hypothetical protein